MYASAPGMYAQIGHGRRTRLPDPPGSGGSGRRGLGGAVLPCRRPTGA